MTDTINIGDVRRVRGIFQDLNEVNTDPTNVTVLINDGTTTTTYIHGVDSEVIKEEVGIYYIDIALTVSGRWWYQWSGVGNVDAMEEDYFDVATSNL